LFIPTRQRALLFLPKDFGLKLRLGAHSLDRSRSVKGTMGGEKSGAGEGGFGSYQDVQPWFIGRQAFLAQEKARKGVVVRFRFNEKGVRMAHSGDPVIDKRGRVVGWVTSCAVDSDGYLTGQAFMS
jgi:glycine cleavage system aminomethyltransferase T